MSSWMEKETLRVQSMKWASLRVWETEGQITQQLKDSVNVAVYYIINSLLLILYSELLNNL